uniref:Zinc finger C2HC-type containing 1C n=1 Tax=Sphenodon punctatus TaxID=8508 RepID=A0A8D0LA48_SPHPU
MARLQLALCPHVDPMVAAPRLPLTGQERYHPSTLGDQSQLENLRSNFQQQLLRDKEERLKGLCIHKGRSYSCSHTAGSNQQGFGQTGFYSAGPNSRYFNNQANTLPSRWTTKRREGVDRAYPLKPVFHRKAGNTVSSIGLLRSPPPMEELPNNRSSLKSRGSLPAVKTQPITAPSLFVVEQPKRPASHSGRAEPAYIQRLEAAGQSLEEEIRRKEALLREKLRRTEEELRRIQWEREVQFPESSTSPAGTALLPIEAGMERFKKERLAASNSKIQDNAPQENLTTSCSDLTSKIREDTPLESSSGQDNVEHTAGELLYSQTPRGGEQGQLAQCSFCRRSFLSARLEKHINICSKSQGSKRKVFDSSIARAKGTELEQYQHWKASDKPQKSNWRQKHESFIRTLRQAREVQQVISKGGRLSDVPRVSPVENPDYISCPHCSRRFAPKVAERHIPKCKTIKNRPPPPPQRKRC